MSDQNNNTILYFFTLMTCLFLFRGSFPVEDMWGFPISLIFCALAYASGMVAMGNLKALIPPRDTMTYLFIFPVYLAILSLNMGGDHAAAHAKIVSFAVSSLPAFYLGWMLGQNKDWPIRIWHVLMCVFAATVLWGAVEIIGGVKTVLLFQQDIYQNLGMLTVFCFIAAVFMQSVWAFPLVIAINFSWYISAFLAAWALLFLQMWSRAKNARLLAGAMFVAGCVFAFLGLGAIYKLLTKIIREIPFHMDLMGLMNLDVAASETQYDRVRLFYEGIVGFLNSPVIGHGTASFYFNDSNYPHNVFIEHMYEHGVIGLFLVLAVLCHPMKKILANLNGTIYARMVGGFFLAALIFSLFGGQTFSRVMLFAIGLATTLPPTDKTLGQIIQDLWATRKKKAISHAYDLQS